MLHSAANSTLDHPHDLLSWLPWIAGRVCRQRMQHSDSRHEQHVLPAAMAANRQHILATVDGGWLPYILGGIDNS